MIRPAQIETGRWWDKPWTLVSGCTRVSAACDHCWALAMETRFGKAAPAKFHPERLDIPLMRKKPTVYAVWNDLFHEAVTDGEITQSFIAMGAARQHSFMVLTKRPERMAQWTQWAASPEGVQDAVGWWPLSNVALGVTVEDQATANERIPHLLQTGAALKFLSMEPLLGPVDLQDYFITGLKPEDDSVTRALRQDMLRPALDLVILGGESGQGARPMHLDWVRSVRDQCEEAGAPFMFKQWGPNKAAGRLLDGVQHDGWFEEVR